MPDGDKEPEMRIPPYHPIAALIEYFKTLIEKANDIITGLKRLERTKGICYNTGTRTITAATTAKLNQPSPPAANYPNREEIWNKLGRVAHIWVHNIGPGNIYVIATDDGQSWAPNETLLERYAYCRFRDSYNLALRADKANTRYRAMECEYNFEVGRTLGGINKPTIIVDDKDVTAAGTAELLPSITIPDGFTLVIKAKPTNVGNIYVGESKAKAEAHVFTLQSNEPVDYGIEDANAIWIDADNNNEGVELTVEQES